MFTLQWGEGPLLLFAHATGLCASAYLGLLAPLGRMFRVVAYDARGHGRSELAADPGQIPTDWKIFRDDLAHLVAALGGGPVRLAGHSFGASVAAEAAADHPGLASALCLIDPPSLPSPAEPGGQAPINLMAQQAERRRSHFESLAAARAAYHGRGAFQGWPEQALDGYLQGALLPDAGKGGVRLACAPAFEAACYHGVTSTFAANIGHLRQPLTLLLADRNSTIDDAGAQAFLERCPQAKVQRFPGTGHFLALTHPDLLRPWLEAL